MPTDRREAPAAQRITADDAARLVRPGDHVFIGTASATPRSTIRALEALRSPPADVEFLANGKPLAIDRACQVNLLRRVTSIGVRWLAAHAQPLAVSIDVRWLHLRVELIDVSTRRVLNESSRCSP